MIISVLKNTVLKMFSTNLFVKKGIGSFMIKFGEMFLKMLLGFVMAKVLGAEQFGIYTYITAIITIMLIPSQLGLRGLLIRFVAEYQVKKKWEELKGIIKFSNIIVLGMLIIIISISMFLLWFDIIQLSEEKIPTFYWAMGVLVFIALNSIRSGTVNGLRYVVLGLLPDTIIKQTVMLILLLLGYYTSFYTSSILAEDAMIFNLTGAIVAFIFGMYFLFKKLPVEVRLSDTKYEFKKWIAIALPFLLNGGMRIISGRIDIILLGWYTTNEQIGVYEIAWRCATLVSIGNAALVPLLGPYFSRYYHGNQHKKLQEIISLSIAVNTIIAVLITLFFIFYGKYFINLFFGEEYAAAYLVMIILSIANLIVSSFGSLGLLLNMTGYQKKVLVGNIMSAVFNIVLNLIFIPLWGIEGAAIASLSTFMIWNLYFYFIAKKRLNVEVSIFGLYNLLVKKFFKK